jgi:hypothetical protein
MRVVPGWTGLARPAAAGYSQRLAALTVCAGVVVLARRVDKLAV